jgi:hypothetical protein
MKEASARIWHKLYLTAFWLAAVWAGLCSALWLYQLLRYGWDRGSPSDPLAAGLITFGPVLVLVVLHRWLRWLRSP